MNFKLIENINEDQFSYYYNRYIKKLNTILTKKKIVDKYDNFIKRTILNNPRYLELFIQEFDNDTNIYIPKSFNISDFNDLIDRYLEFKRLNLFTLEVISKNTKIRDFKIDYKNKVKAR
ncbi:hypothetical protein, partial [Staphylococcus epidermidis]|uniref:hypothetical protein n=1 Tax=Staphylococcus epidermidis TaxID=1282 RepID=UPI00117B35DA